MTTNTDGAMPELPDNDIDGEEIGKIIADCTVTFEGGFSHLDNDMFASVIRSAMGLPASSKVRWRTTPAPQSSKPLALYPKGGAEREAGSSVHLGGGEGGGVTQPPTEETHE